MTFQTLIGIAVALWLCSIAACAVAFGWSLTGTPRRFLPSVLLAVAALIMGYFGLTHFHLAASKTVNGQVQWSFNSKWFFIATLVLSAATLAYTVYRKTTSRPKGGVPLAT